MQPTPDHSYSQAEEAPLGRMPTHPCMTYERIMMQTHGKNLNSSINVKAGAISLAFVFGTMAAIAAYVDEKPTALALGSNTLACAAVAMGARRREHAAAHHLNTTATRYERHHNFGPAMARITPLWQEFLSERQIQTISQTRHQAEEAPIRDMWKLASWSAASVAAATAFTATTAFVPLTLATVAAFGAARLHRAAKPNHEDNGWKIVQTFEASKDSLRFDIERGDRGRPFLEARVREFQKYQQSLLARQARQKRSP